MTSRASRGLPWALLVAPLAIAMAVLLVPTLALAQTSGSDTGAFARALSKGLLVAGAACFGAGFAASLTPCVYPMITITVSIFGAAQAKSKLHAASLSGVFVLGIAALYVPVGVVASLFGKQLGATVSNPWVVGAVALIFSALAASMFGAFEMALPASWNNRLSRVGGLGYRGAFGLGVVSGLVATPCTGPFVTGIATWLLESRNIALGVYAMFMFSLGLGLLFFIVGTFASHLPKAGAWMMGIKWGSGVALAYLALAYVRDISPRLQKLIQPGVVFGAIAIAVAAVGLVLGLLHIAAERRKSSLAPYSTKFKLASILPAVAGTYLVFSWAQLSPANADTSAPPIVWANNTTAKSAHERATTEKKPMMIDFGASWCKACKELEHDTFPDARVRAEAMRFVAVQIDGTDDEDDAYKTFTEKYKVIGLPTVVLVDSAGKEAARFTEFVPPAKFRDALAKVH